MNKLEILRPLYIQANPRDNVAIIVNEGGLPSGTLLASGLVLVEGSAGSA